VEALSSIFASPPLSLPFNFTFSLTPLRDTGSFKRDTFLRPPRSALHPAPKPYSTPLLVSPLVSSPCPIFSSFRFLGSSLPPGSEALGSTRHHTTRFRPLFLASPSPLSCIKAFGPPPSCSFLQTDPVMGPSLLASPFSWVFSVPLMFVLSYLSLAKVQEWADPRVGFLPSYVTILIPANPFDSRAFRYDSVPHDFPWGTQETLSSFCLIRGRFLHLGPPSFPRLPLVFTSNHGKVGPFFPAPP